MMKSFGLEEIGKHNQEGDCWVVIAGDVYDVSTFMNFHPGSKGLLLRVAGTDCTDEFFGLHRASVLDRYKKLVIGKLEGGLQGDTVEHGAMSKVPYAEWDSPFYTESHFKFRAACRRFLERELLPFTDQWANAEKPPPVEFIKKMGDEGFIACSLGPGPHLSMVERLPGGVTPETFDYFHEVIVHEELKRCGSWGLVDGIGGGLLIGLSPVLNFGSKLLIERIVPDILKGNTRICLAISDPYAGSDVANTTCIAEKSADGSHFVVNGVKKWITGGTTADYFATAVRTRSSDGKQSSGHAGVSFLLIERSAGGVDTEHIKTSYSGSAGTAFVTFENVRVPVGNLLGKENEGFKAIMANFNHERWAMAVGGNRLNRLIVEDCFKWAYHRKVFGKRLIHQPQIQERLASMIGHVNSVQAWIDNVTHQMNNMTYAEQTRHLAGTISMLKNQQVEASEIVSDGAVQIFGGRALTRGGLGSNVERFQRSFQFGAVLGGTKLVLATQAIRHALKSMPPDSRL
mmetsp:Transcript_214/g.429  ORF Transcript_214/g.429 Transcript_214/m.429 type:complete len:515 (-) Transcript_214:20-1564(-)|eukprot:CAMPEP_0203759494 /NCGR_PEP_ID=MMETSP0098-20131031/12550_1 /ASSEMBLY_ACC=CAM_ASM_000208 /TAXON_ID=96639 /ORGANISM=" , Strain NY0313808BC1" /LENGTH=514 /DNA_ID=CAMNT_0050652503 /DNA_START=272 /DNA_END=1816 /DNA_ORIENTATION=+